MNEATIVATNVQLTPEFAKRRRGDSQEEAKNKFQDRRFLYMCIVIYSIISGWTQRFEAPFAIAQHHLQ